MRDIARIGPFMALFEKLWKTYPDIRFGQLVECIYSKSEGRADLFNIEDDNMYEALRRFYAEYAEKRPTETKEKELSDRGSEGVEG